MGAVSEGSVPLAKAKVMRGIIPAVPKPEAPIHCGYGCFRDRSRGRVDVGPRIKSTTPSVHE